MDKLKCCVVMLPSNQKARISQLIDDKLVIDEPIGICQHLYFISNREIKEGEYFLSSTGVVMIHNKRSYTGMISRRIVESDKKIESTTDPTLGLPLIPQSFVNVFVEGQGKIEEVMIEMEQESSTGYTEDRSRTFYGELSTKLRKDNTVICSPVKDTWTREEVIRLLRQVHKDSRIPYSYIDVHGIEKWIEEQL